MNELLSNLKTYEIWIYIFLGIVGLWYVRKLILAIAEWQASVFGLEKEGAQRKISESTSAIIVIVLVAAGWFLLVSYIAPILPNAEALATPTLDLLATQTATLPVSAMSIEITPTVSGTQLPNGCIPGQIEFTFPTDGSEVKGKLDLQGNVSTTDFGFYKYEYTELESGVWNTIAAGSQPITDAGNIGVWDTSQLAQGDYLLRLVVTDHQGSELPACVIQIRITAP